MNETLKTIFNRRSIRTFDNNRPVPEDKIRTLLDAAIMAPSTRNTQMWHFSVVRSKEIIDKMVARTKENIMKSENEFLKGRASSPDYHTFHRAPVVIVISGDPNARNIRFDIGAAAENICLAATSLGLGTCIIASSDYLFEGDDREEIKKMLGIPPGYEHICCIAVGYNAAAHPEAPERKKDVFTFID